MKALPLFAHRKQWFGAFRQKGLVQIRQYRDKFGAQTPAYLMIFDRRPESVLKNWDERITWEIDGDVAVLGC